MKNQRRVQWGLTCWLTYLSAYLCRVNFSAALTSLSASIGVDYSLLGAAGAAFFAVYAVGQLMNGFLGDHINPVRFILAALAGTVLCNAGVAFAHSFALIFLLWALNGYFQSIFWSTMIRVLALTVSKSQRGATSAAISSAMPAGYLASWCVLAPCFASTDAKWFFLAPALAALPMMLLWTGRERELPDVSNGRMNIQTLRADVSALLKLVKAEHMALLLCACIFHGLIKEGVGFWFPTIIREAADSTLLATLALALFPAANFLGTLIAKRLLSRFGDRPYRIVAGCFAAMTPLCISVKFFGGIGVLAPMCLISALSYCSNTVLMSFIPMQYQSKGFVASLVGLLDFCSYLGAALSAYVLGGMLNQSGLAGISLVWLAAACASVMLLALQQKTKRA